MTTHNHITQDEVLQLVRDTLSCNPDSVTLDTNLANDVGLDSLDRLGLIMEIESFLDIEISVEDAAKLATVGDIVNYLRGRGCIGE